MVSSNIDAYRIHLRNRKESEIYMKLIKQIPREDGFYMPGEFEPHQGCILIWPKRPGSWGYEAKAAGNAFAAVIKAIAQSEKVYVAVTKETLPIAQEKLFGENKNADIMQQDNIELFFADTDDAWARDTGPTFVINDKGERRGINWEFNAWGGSYDGLYSHWENDQVIPSLVCEYLGDDLYEARPFVLEGGSIHVDGEGTLITTEECLLNLGRNPTMTRDEIEEKLKHYLNVEKIIWLPYGIYNDETNGHVDNFCCFVRPGVVLLAWTDDENDPQFVRSHMAYEILSHEIDAKGRPLVIHKLPIPRKPVCINEEDLKGYVFEEGEDIREAGERLAASYINFYIGNHCILVPQFGDEHDSVAVEILKECFPERDIIPIEARVILTGGGNIHCITQQIPAKEVSNERS